MTTINLTTKINASIQIVFDTARDIDLHQKSTATSNEKAIAGVTTGVINEGETVTWRGKHFGFYLTHKTRITKMDFYDYFLDEMEEGNFKSFRHKHYFKEINGVTIMTDLLQYETPFGIFGKLFDVLLLKKHLTKFLLERNKILTETAENESIIFN